MKKESKKSTPKMDEGTEDTYTSGDHPTPEAAETALDEANESPEVQAREVAEGTEQHEGAPIPEEFQMQAVDICKGASKEQCAFLSNLISERQTELAKLETEGTEDEGVSMDDYAKVKE